jgi:cyclopropane fatty-acyl-phospholipid synthase-like methyltransferase
MKKDPLLEKILSLLDLKPGIGHDILDVGCGSGDLSDWYGCNEKTH